MGACKSMDPSPSRVDVLVRHAIQGSELSVSVKTTATFKDVKKAIARRTGKKEVMVKGQLVKKENGIYKAHKDHLKLGETRTVMVICADLTPDSAIDQDTSDEEPAEVAEVPAMLSTATEVRMESRTDVKAETASAGPVSLRHPPKGEPTLTRDQALAVQRELRAGFQEELFQRQLVVLHEAYDPRSADFAKARQKLTLSVQEKVLPKFGFEGTLSGVYKLMGALGPWVEDREFVIMGIEVNEILGVEIPPETWAKLVETINLPQPEPERRETKPRNAARNTAARSQGPRLPGFGLPMPGNSMMALSVKTTLGMPSVGLSGSAQTERDAHV